MSRRILAFLVPLLLLMAFPAAAGDRPAATAILVPPENIGYPALEFQVPKAERFLLSNGVVVWFLEDREVPLVAVQAYLKTGSCQDPEGKEGLAELTATVMRTGGTRSLTGRAVDERLDFLAAEMGLDAGLETTTAGLSVLKKDLAEGLAILSGVLREPAFEESRLSLARELMKEDLRRVADDPQRLAFREFSRFFYRHDPRGRLSTLASLDAIRRQDLVLHHRRFFAPRNLWIAVSGDLSRKEAEAALERAFGTWTAPLPPAPLPAPPVPNPRGIRLIPRDTPQSVVVIGHPAPPREAGDHLPFRVLDFLLGSGGFTSRIFQEVRTDRGLAYSTGSFYRGRRGHGLFGAYALTRTDATIPVLELLEKILGESGKGAFTPADLRLAKDSLLHRFLFSFQSPEQIVSSRLLVEFDGLPADYLETYRDNIRRVTRADLQATAMRWLDRERASILVLGNARAFGGRLDSHGTVTEAP